MVRSEVFNIVVHESEALTYKIMVLPKNDPEVQAMRNLAASREKRGEEDADDVSNASADTVLADESGRPLPEPPHVTNEEMHAFLATEQGERYYQEWCEGRISCKQVCLRSGAGLLAKFFQSACRGSRRAKDVADGT